MLFEEWCAIVFTLGTFHDEFLNFYIDSQVKCADFYISSCKTNKAIPYTFWLTQFNGSLPSKGLLYMVTCYKSPWIIHSSKFLIIKPSTDEFSVESEWGSYRKLLNFE